MAQIRDYTRGVSENITLSYIGTNDGKEQPLKNDGVLVNGFNSLVLYTDEAGTTAVPVDYYTMAGADSRWTADEALTGGTGETVYSAFQVTNASYQNIDLWADFQNFGVYTSQDAAFDQQGGSVDVSATGSISIPEGYHKYRVNIDTTSADVTITVGDGQFDGQQILLKETGNGNKCRVLGSGFYAGADSGGMYLVDRSILCTWNADDSLWEMNDCVVAEWVDGDNSIISKSSGVISIKSSLADYVTGSNTITIPISITFTAQDISATFDPGIGQAQGEIMVFNPSSWTTTSYIIRITNIGTPGSSRYIHSLVSGKY